MKKRTILMMALMPLIFSSCDENTVVDKEQMVVINPPTLTLALGDAYTLQLNVYPDAELASEVSWTSSDEAVATVSEDGQVTAVSSGEAVITASVPVGEATCSVTVTDVPVELITIDPTSLTISKAPGRTEQLTVTILPEEASSVTVKWSSSDEAVATVDESGVVTPVGAGNCNIIAEAGGKYASSSITVEAIRLSETEIEVIYGRMVTLEAEILSSQASDLSIEWSSSDESIADVPYGYGMIFTKAQGDVIISATAGDMVSECVVKVVDYDIPDGVGDFIYSDGSRSSELESGKTPVGVVFWVGDPTEHDAALRRDYPECTHGLAVALEETSMRYMSEDETTAWKSLGYSEWIEAHPSDQYESNYESGYPFAIRGYNNTLALKALDEQVNDVELRPIQAVHEYSESHPLPDGTSGWYIPSLQELHLLATGFDVDCTTMNSDEILNHTARFMNTKIGQVSGADELSIISSDPTYGEGTLYWSSTESPSDFYERILRSLNMAKGDAGSAPMSYEYIVRYVFAF